MKDFYARLDKFEDDLREVGGSLWQIFNVSNRLSHIAQELAGDAEKIEDKGKRGRFIDILLYLSIRLNEIGNQCNELSEEVYWMREYPASELIVGAEEWAKPEINRTMCAEVEKKRPN